MVPLEERQVRTQSGVVVAQGSDSPTARRPRLAKIQGAAFDKARVELPPSLGQDRLEDLGRAASDTVFHSNATPSSVGLDHLRIE